jgi:hypothetical protein
MRAKRFSGKRGFSVDHRTPWQQAMEGRRLTWLEIIVIWLLLGPSIIAAIAVTR